MGIIRNSIDVVGITPESDIPKTVMGQIIEYSETEYISILQDQPGIKNIIQVILEIEIKFRRVINAASEKIVVLDGIKKYCIIYTENRHPYKRNVVNIQLPYNTFIEVFDEESTKAECKIYVLDAYFQAVESRRIYSHIIYMINMPDAKLPENKLKEKKIYVGEKITSKSSAFGEIDVEVNGKKCDIDIESEFL